jgi:hypothetical protein
MTIGAKAGNPTKVTFICPFPPSIRRPEQEDEQMEMHLNVKVGSHVAVQFRPQLTRI